MKFRARSPLCASQMNEVIPEFGGGPYSGRGATDEKTESTPATSPGRVDSILRFDTHHPTVVEGPLHSAGPPESPAFDRNVNPAACGHTVEARSKRRSTPRSPHGASGDDRKDRLRKDAPLTEDDVQKAFASAPQSEPSEGFSPSWWIMLKLFVMRLAHNLKKRCTSLDPCQLLERTFPIIPTLRTYQKSYINLDLAGGVSEGIMHIPMGMSYSLLAEMPPQFGLYNSLIYPLVYLALGTGRQASMGVSALEALLCSEAVTAVVGTEASLNLRVQTTVALSLLIGCVMFLMRFLGLSIIAHVLADPVLSGFCTASAFIIGGTQLKHLFGLSVPRWNLPTTLWHIVSHIDEANWLCFAIGVVSVVILSTVKWLNKKLFRKFPLPGQVFVILLSTLTVYLAAPKDGGQALVPVVGDIPRGLPHAKVPSFAPGIFAPLLREAVTLSCMYFIIHVSITKSLSRKRNYKIDSGQELTALGTANIVGSFFQCFPNATSLSRSSVLNSIGSKTVMHNVPAVIVVILTLTVLTPLLYYLPLSALASIVLVGVAGMVDFGEAVHLFGLMSPDIVLWLAAFIGTILLGAMKGIIASVALSLLWILWKSSRPRTAVLGCLPGTVVYRNVKRFPMACESDGIKIFRFDASLNFSNSDFFENKLDNLNLKECNISVLIIDGSSINFLDATAIRMLQRVVAKFDECGIILLFANWKGPMRDFLDRARFYDSVLPERCFLSLHDAVVWSEAYIISLRQQDKLERATPSYQSTTSVTFEDSRQRRPDTPVEPSSQRETIRRVLPGFCRNRGSFTCCVPIRTNEHRLLKNTLSAKTHSSPAIVSESPSPVRSLMSEYRHNSPSCLIRTSTTLDTSVLDLESQHDPTCTPAVQQQHTGERHPSTMERARALLRAVTQPHVPSPPDAGGTQERARIEKALGMVGTHSLGLTCGTLGMVRDSSSASLSIHGLGATVPGASPSHPSSVSNKGRRRPMTANPLSCGTCFKSPRTRCSYTEQPGGAYIPVPEEMEGTTDELHPIFEGSAVTVTEEMEGLVDERRPIFEWDGLSARIPSVRLVEEFNERGEQRTWRVAATLDASSGIWYTNDRAKEAWLNG